MTQPHAYVATASEFLPIAEAIAGEWDAMGISGHLLARNVDTGDELGFDAEEMLPLASVIKVPIALVVLELFDRGELDPALQVTVDSDDRTLGWTGIASFRHPVTIALGDLVTSMLTVSDNAAGDVLLGLAGIDRATAALERWGCPGVRIRHRLHRMYECAAGVAGGDFGLALDLAIESDQTGRHVIETLDPDYANVGSARALVDLLQRIWRDQIAAPSATAELRRLMSMQVFTHRLSSDLRTDSVRVSGKTGTFLHLRHEIGVVESATGDRVVIAALTRSGRRAEIAPDIDLAIGAAGRSAFEALRA